MFHVFYFKIGKFCLREGRFSVQMNRPFPSKLSDGTQFKGWLQM